MSYRGWVRGLLLQGLFIPSKSNSEEVRSPCQGAPFAGLLLFHNNRESHHCESSLHALCRTTLFTDISLVCFPGALRYIYCSCSHCSDKKGKAASGDPFLQLSCTDRGREGCRVSCVGHLRFRGGSGTAASSAYFPGPQAGTSLAAAENDHHYWPHSLLVLRDPEDSWENGGRP